jgi:hypothetical protein
MTELATTVGSLNALLLNLQNAPATRDFIAKYIPCNISSVHHHHPELEFSNKKKRVN